MTIKKIEKIILSNNKQNMCEDEHYDYVMIPDQDDYVVDTFGKDYSWSFEKTDWATQYHEVKFGTEDNCLENGIYVGINMEDIEDSMSINFEYCWTDFEQNMANNGLMFVDEEPPKGVPTTKDIDCNKWIIRLEDQDKVNE